MGTLVASGSGKWPLLTGCKETWTSRLQPKKLNSANNLSKHGSEFQPEPPAKSPDWQTPYHLVRPWEEYPVEHV